MDQQSVIVQAARIMAEAYRYRVNMEAVTGCLLIAMLFALVAFICYRITRDN